MKRLINSTERKFYDENGNLKVETTAKTIVHKSIEDSFYMAFTNYIMWIYQVKSTATLKILYKILEKAEFNTGRVDITAGFRSQLESELDLCKSQITKSLTELTNKKVLIQQTQTKNGKEIPLKGCYMVNPEMFWKGDLKTRKELKITFESIPEDDLSNNEKDFDNQIIDTETGEIN